MIIVFKPKNRNIKNTGLLIFMTPVRRTDRSRSFAGKHSNSIKNDNFRAQVNPMQLLKFAVRISAIHFKIDSMTANCTWFNISIQQRLHSVYFDIHLFQRRKVPELRSYGIFRVYLSENFINSSWVYPTILKIDLASCTDFYWAKAQQNKWNWIFRNWEHWHWSQMGVIDGLWKVNFIRALFSSV